ncbi:MAG: hypothetical protein WCO06_07080 [Candidatus Roizmanbacteria bacterium]
MEEVPEYVIIGRSRVKFRQLRINTHPDIYGLYTITRWESDDSIKVGLNYITVIHLLSLKNSISKTADVMNISVKEVKDIILQLIEQDIVYQIGKDILPNKSIPIRPLFPQIEHKYFSWFISPWFLFPSLFFISVGSVIGIITPGYFPTFKNYFWTQDYFTAYMTAYCAGIIFLFIHELGHYIATRAVGGQASMTIGIRFTSIVAETISYHIATIPKDLRYFIYASGIYFDLLVISSCYLVFFFADFFKLNLGMTRLIMMVIVMNQMRGIVWQFNAYLKTDIYNFLTDFLDHEYLQENATKFILNKLKKVDDHFYKPFRIVTKKMIRKDTNVLNSDDLRTLKHEDVREMKVYTIVLIAGFGLSIMQLVTYTFPKDCFFLMGVLKTISHDLSTLDFIGILKSLIIFGLISSSYIMIIVNLFHSKKGGKN